MPAYVVANFDAEIELARWRTPGPHPDLPAAVARRLTTLASHLAIVDEDVVVVRDPGDVPAGAAAVIGWAETPSIAAARARLARPAPPDAPLWRAIADPAVVAEVNDRRFWLGLARRLGWALPATIEIDSVDQLRRALPALVDASADGGWSVKAPLSAAGRDRVHRWGAALPDDMAVRIGRLLDRFGVLIAEPWMPRVADVGVVGLVDEAGLVSVRAPHVLESDRSGTFRAVVVGDERAVDPAFTGAALDAGAALAAAGYRGPFGIDGFAYTAFGGGEAVMPACEINARMTFGLIAHLARDHRSPGAPLRWQP